jgi:hypothetical protein
MSKFIEVTTRAKMLINTNEIVSVEPTEYFNGNPSCMITLIHTTKRCTEGRKIITKETYDEVKQMIMED